MKGMLKIIMAVAIMSLVTFPALAETVDIRANIPSMSELNVDISRIIGDTWTPHPSGIDFGTLEWDDQWDIFRSAGGCYYAVDAGVLDNIGSWSIQHSISPISNGSGEDLDDNINATFVKCIYTGPITDPDEYDLSNVSYANANKTYTKAQLKEGTEQGWLRIYYGIANGSDDNPAVVVITSDKPAGTYTGQITLTLTQ